MLTRRAARVGFDWEKPEDILDKLEEEIREFKEAIKRKESHIREEAGDILFTMVNLSRHFQIDPEYALSKTSEKFIKRFKKIGGISRK